MPEVDGLSLIKRIKEHRLPIVSLILSGYDNFQYAQKAMIHGVSEYLLKPVEFETLAEALSRSKEKLETLRDLNQYVIRFQNLLENKQGLPPQVVLQKHSDLLKSVLQLHHINKNAKLSLLRIFDNKLKSALGHGFIPIRLLQSFAGKVVPGASRRRRRRQARSDRALLQVYRGQLHEGHRLDGNGGADEFQHFAFQRVIQKTYRAFLNQLCERPSHRGGEEAAVEVLVFRIGNRGCGRLFDDALFYESIQSGRRRIAAAIQEEAESMKGKHWHYRFSVKTKIFATVFFVSFLSIVLMGMISSYYYTESAKNDFYLIAQDSTARINHQLDRYFDQLSRSTYSSIAGPLPANPILGSNPESGMIQQWLTAGQHFDREQEALVEGILTRYIALNDSNILGVVLRSSDQRLIYSKDIALAKRLKPMFLDYDFNRITPDEVRACRAAGIEVSLWTINRREESLRFIEAGVDYITTDTLLTEE